MIRVYVATKLKNGGFLRGILEPEPHVFLHARWLKHTVLKTPDTAEHAEEFWLQDEQDVKDADVVLVYAEKDDHLRGALVEAGMAIAYGVPVVVVGHHADYGTWQHHPLVSRTASLDDAIALLLTLEPRYRRLKR